MRVQFVIKVTALTLLIAANVGSHAFALSCPVPTAKKYHSSNKEYYFEVTPRKNSVTYAEGALYKLGAEGKYHQVWSSHLSNKVSPERVLVANSGSYVVTLDNWCAAGRGDNIVVIYGSGGKLIKKFALREIASKGEIGKFKFTSDGVRWGGEHFLYERSGELVLKVKTGGFNLVSDAKPPHYVREYRAVRISLSTGEIINLAALR